MATNSCPAIPSRNSRATITGSITSLFIGEYRKETVSHSGKKFRPTGNDLCEWDSFEEEVLEWYTSSKIQQKFHQSAQIPVGFDAVEADKLNREIAKPQCQVGAEISVCSALEEYLLAPVLRCHKAMGLSGPGITNITIGDHWIADRPPGIGDGKKQPDFVTKVTFDRKLEVPLVGEIKFPRTSELGNLVRKAHRRIAQQLANIMGQLVEYMIRYRTKFGFLTNYDYTIFVMIALHDGNPRLCFSNPIANTSVVKCEPGSKGTIRLSLALLYFLHITTEDGQDGRDAWYMDDEVHKEASKWILKEKVQKNELNTPYTRWKSNTSTNGTPTPAQRKRRNLD